MQGEVQLMAQGAVQPGKEKQQGVQCIHTGLPLLEEEVELRVKHTKLFKS